MGLIGRNPERVSQWHALFSLPGAKDLGGASGGRRGGPVHVQKQHVRMKPAFPEGRV